MIKPAFVVLNAGIVCGKTYPD